MCPEVVMGERGVEGEGGIEGVSVGMSRIRQLYDFSTDPYMLRSEGTVLVREQIQRRNNATCGRDSPQSSIVPAILQTRRPELGAGSADGNKWYLLLERVSTRSVTGIGFDGTSR